MPSTEITEALDDHRVSREAEAPLVYPVQGAPESGQTIDIAPGIKWLRMPLPFELSHINLYLIEDGDGWAIIDTGINTSLVRGMWEKVLADDLEGANITKIIVTHYHPDHMGCAGWLAEVTGAPIWMTGLEMMTGRTLKLDVRDEVPEEAIQFYETAGFDEDQITFLRQLGFGNFAKGVSDLPLAYKRIRGGDVIEIGARRFEILIGNGHSPEHACLYERAEKLLISGDQVLPRITSNISVHPTEPLSNPLHDWMTSLVMLEQLPDDIFVLPAHNEPFLGLKKRVDEMLLSHFRRLKRVAAECQVPCSAVGAFGAMFKRKLKGFDMIMGLGESLAHLHYLESIGVVERIEGDVTTFQTIGEFDEDDVKRDIGIA